MLTLLLVGLLLGMKHALDADHVAALAALATRSTSVKEAVRQGVVWGAGHTLTLLAFAGVVLATDANIPKGTADAPEFAVGVMLVLLGLEVLRRAYRQKRTFTCIAMPAASCTFMRTLTPMIRRRTVLGTTTIHTRRLFRCVRSRSG